MGERRAVEATQESLDGRYESLKAYDGAHLASIVIALSEALDGASGVHAAGALAAIHAVDALPRLRETLSRTGTGSPTSEGIVAAIQALESRASLPRPAYVDVSAERFLE